MRSTRITRNIYEQSVGVGVRWLSPIGQVRVDVAFALTKDDWWEDREGSRPPGSMSSSGLTCER